MKLFFKKYGQGPAMVIVHGLYGSSDNWAMIAKALGKHFEVYVIDQRNHGRSPHSNEHNYDLMREDLYEFAMDHNIENAIFLGHSMGGKTVMHFAATYPELVNGLVVVDIAPKSYKLSPDLMRHTTDHKAILNSIDRIDPNEYGSREDIDRELGKTIESERVRQFLLKNLVRNGGNGYKWKLNIKVLNAKLDSVLTGINEKDFEKGKGITGFPVLFVKGARSNYILNGDLDLIKTVFPYADMVSIPDAGHWLHVEKPGMLVEAVLENMLGD